MRRILFFLVLASALSTAVAQTSTVPGIILGRGIEGVEGRRVDDFLLSRGASIQSRTSGTGIFVIRTQESSVDTLITAMKESKLFDLVERDWYARLAGVPNDPRFAEQWYLKKIGALDSWEEIEGSSGPVIAIVDSGVDRQHPDLAGKFSAGWNFVAETSDTTDHLGHGTMVAGLLGATPNNYIGIAGLAPTATLLPLVVTDPQGRARYSDVMRAVEYAADHGARLVNVSVGGDEPSEGLRLSVEYAWKKGALVVAAALNDGASRRTYPASCNHVLAVTATDETDGPAGFANYGDWITLSAPGTNLLTTVIGGGYEAHSGTSLASALVTGVAAAVLAQNPDLTPDAVQQLLKTNAEPLGTNRFDEHFGWGRINASRSIKAAHAMASTLSVATDAHLSRQMASGAVAPKLSQQSAALSISNVSYDYLAHSSIRIKWDTSAPGYFQVKYGVTSQNYLYATVSNGPATQMSVAIGALKPSTTYYFRAASRPNRDDDIGICQDDTCGSTELVVTTPPEPAIHPELPVAPTNPYNPVHPDTTGYTTVSLKVGPSGECVSATDNSSLQTVLNTVNYGTIIEFPQGATCKVPPQNSTNAGYALPAKPLDPSASGDINSPSHRWIVLRTAGAPENFPPPGVRTSPAWAGRLAKLVAQAPSTNFDGQIFYGVSAVVHHFWIENLELTHTADPSVYPADVIDPAPFMYLAKFESTYFVDSPPQYIVMDRLYVHGTGFPGRLRFGIGLGGAHQAVINSWVGPVDYWRPLQSPSGNVKLSANQQSIQVDPMSIQRRAGEAVMGMAGPATLTLTSAPGNNGRFVGYLAPNGLTVVYTAGAGTLVCSGCASVQSASPATPSNCFELFSGTITGAALSLSSVNTGQYATSRWNTEGSVAIEFIDGGAGPYNISNNHIEGYGIGFYTDAGGAAANSPITADVVWQRNHHFWNQNHRYTSSSSDGLAYVVRQHWETKRAKRWLVDGNIFEGNWANLNEGTTFFLSGRATYNRDADQGISDILFSNNIVRDSSFGFSCEGMSGGPDPAITKRVRFTNNLVYGINEWLYDAGSPNGNGGVTENLGGCQDLTVNNNTFGLNVGRGPWNILFGVFGALAEGYRFSDNIMYFSLGLADLWGGIEVDDNQNITSHPRIPAIDYSGPFSRRLDTYSLRLGATAEPNYSFRNNVIIGGVHTPDAASQRDFTAADVALYSPQFPAGNFFPQGDSVAAREQTVGFTNVASHDYRLTPSSPYRGMASNGGDPGANLDQIQVANGFVSGIQVTPGAQNNVQVSYIAPDTNQCSVDVSPDNFSTVRRVSDGGGARNRSINITGMLPNTTYSYRILCAFEQVSGASWLEPFSPDQTTNGTFSLSGPSPVPQPTAPGAATFVKADTTTQGSWKRAYGADGFNVIGDSTSYPSYVAVTPQGYSYFTFASSTSDTRGLQRAASTATDRVAACWYTGATMTIGLQFSDSATHQVAVYMVDWDGYGGGRSQRVDVVDGNGAVLDSRTVSSFSEGAYLVWNLSGQVSLRITNTNPSGNAVAFGLFFGGAPTTGSAGTGTATYLKADTAAQGTWQGVYGADGYNVIGDAANYPAYVAVTPSGNLTYVWQNPTSDVRGLQKATSPGRIAGTWYTAGTMSVDLRFTDTQTHQVALYFADWDGYGGGRSERIDVVDANGNLLDSRTATAFGAGEYLVWNLSGHVTVRVTNTNPASNAVLLGVFFGGASAGGSPSASGTANYLKADTATQGTWQGVYGADGYNVIGDAANYPAYVAVTPSGNLTYVWQNPTSDVRGLQKATSPGRIAGTWYTAGTMSVDLRFTDTQTHQVALYFADWDGYGGGRSERIDVVDANGNLLDSRTATAFGAGEYLVWNLSGHVTVRVTNTNPASNAVLLGVFFGGASAGGSPAAINTAAFVKVDTATVGTWKGVYGGDGYNVIGEAANYPAYVAVTPSGNLSYIWQNPTSDVRGLQKPTSADRIASCWYSSTSFTVDLTFADVSTHQMALYLLDWDLFGGGRTERIDILDANGTVLDTRTAAGFSQGEYLIWNVTGHVVIQITNTNPNSNATMSGLFFR